MQELTVIIPTKDNAGKAMRADIAAFELFLLDTCGGFTRERVNGAWKSDNGKVYRDSSYRYTLVGNIEPIQTALPALCRVFRQECLYTSLREVSVSLVYPLVVAA